jgi:hypothetical protein
MKKILFFSILGCLPFTQMASVVTRNCTALPQKAVVQKPVKKTNATSPDIHMNMLSYFMQ